MYDIIIIGSGPGGYAGAIRASQLGKRVAVVERAELGGVCLNWGCIPTKALLKSAQVLSYARKAADFGVEFEGCEGGGVPVANLGKMVERSRGVSSQMNKGVEFLMKKHGIDVLRGEGRIVRKGCVGVGGVEYECGDIIVATGARSRVLPSIPVDGDRVITSREALVLSKLPESMVVVGSGAIGLEFASFYSSLGVKVSIVEYLDRIAPLEDSEISSALERVFRKNKVTLMTSTEVLSVENNGGGCSVLVSGKKGEQRLEVDVVLSAVGVVANIEGLGLDDIGVDVERGRILVDTANYRTSVEGVYAIGDVIGTPALAHVATAEAIACVEGICGHSVSGVDYGAIPSCIYTDMEVASVGLTESQAVDGGVAVTVGRFSLLASGKAVSAGSRDGLVKLVFAAEGGELLGAHLCGLNVTEMVSGLTYMVQHGVTAREIVECVHPHPSISECIMEAAASALGEAIHG